MIWKDYAIDYGSSCLIKYHEPYMHLSGTFFPSAGIVDADYGADDDSPVGVNVSKVLAPLWFIAHIIDNSKYTQELSPEVSAEQSPGRSRTAKSGGIGSAAYSTHHMVEKPASLEGYNANQFTMCGL